MKTIKCHSCEHIICEIEKGRADKLAVYRCKRCETILQSEVMRLREKVKAVDEMLNEQQADMPEFMSNLFR